MGFKSQPRPIPRSKRRLAGQNIWLALDSISSRPSCSDSSKHGGLTEQTTPARRRHHLWRRTTWETAAPCAASSGLEPRPPAVQQFMAASPIQPPHAAPQYDHNTGCGCRAVRIRSGAAVCATASGRQCGMFRQLPHIHCQGFPAAAGGHVGDCHGGTLPASGRRLALSPFRNTSGSPAMSALNTSAVARLTASIQQHYSGGQPPAVSQPADDGRSDQRHM